MKYSASTAKKILDEVRLNADSTKDISFPTKEYIKAIFNAVRNNKVGASGEGTGGMHSGGAKVAHRTGSKAPDTYSTISIVSEKLLFADTPGYIKRSGLSKIGTDKILKFPNMDEYRRSENKRKEYLLANPTYAGLKNNTPFQEFVTSYAEDAMWLAEDPKENTKYYIQTDTIDGILFGAMVKYIKLGKGDSEWIPVVSSEYVSGPDRDLLHNAVKYFIDSNPEFVAKVMKGEVNSDEGMFDPITTANIIGANPKITMSYQTIKDSLPKTFTGNIADDIGHDYTMDLSNPKKHLLYLGNTTQDRVNDAKLADRGVNASTKVYLFTFIEPNENGEFTQFPGKIVMAHSFARASGDEPKLGGLTPGYVYSVNIDRSFYPTYPTVRSQSIGKEGERINSIPMDPEVIRKAIPTGVRPNFNEPELSNIEPTATKPTTKPEENKVSAQFESKFMWMDMCNNIVREI